MHKNYTVGLTTGQYKAFQMITNDPQEWIMNAMKNRANIATNEIVSKYTAFKINKGEAITAIGTTAVIDAAYSEGVVGILTDTRGQPF